MLKSALVSVAVFVTAAVLAAPVLADVFHFLGAVVPRLLAGA